jgi:hypothetical protein
VAVFGISYKANVLRCRGVKQISSSGPMSVLTRSHQTLSFLQNVNEIHFYLFLLWGETVSLDAEVTRDAIVLAQDD